MFEEGVDALRGWIRRLVEECDHIFDSGLKYISFCYSQAVVCNGSMLLCTRQNLKPMDEDEWMLTSLNRFLRKLILEIHHLRELLMVMFDLEHK